MKKFDPIPISEIEAAKKCISNEIIRTPLVRLNINDSNLEIFLKLETLQPIRAFKIRGACNAIKRFDKDRLKKGVWTVSAGNWAQGLAWFARKLGIKCTILVPKHIPKSKEDSIKHLGARVIKIPVKESIKVLSTREYKGMTGLFMHPFSDQAVMAGNATIGLEILEDLPELDTVLIPWGGGGLACGIASAIRIIKPNAKIFACEIETATPLATTYALDSIPKNINYTPSFVDGIGLPFILPEMWDLAKRLLDGSFVVGLKETAQAIRLLVKHNCIVAEGAGAVSVTAALAGKGGNGKVVCIVSGGNIDTPLLTKILQGNIP